MIVLILKLLKNEIYIDLCNAEDEENLVLKAKYLNFYSGLLKPCNLYAGIHNPKMIG